jgi:hypothetical protein
MTGTELDAHVQFDSRQNIVCQRLLGHLFNTDRDGPLVVIVTR